jgi:DNA-binding transcriptional MerR regulator
MTDNLWRIDDLAHRAGVSVDTIRYYQRESLLPAPERAGRTKRYGPEHLLRLERIRELQGRRFSLAAIRALLDAERPGLVEGIFGGPQGTQYSFDELVERAGVARSLAGRLRDPAEFGRDAYDAADLDALHAVAELARVGLPDDVLVEMASIYARGIEAMQRQVLDLFAGKRGPHWDPDDLAAFQNRSSEAAGSMLPFVTRIVAYVHQRTLQRLTLGAIEAARATPDRADD